MPERKRESNGPAGASSAFVERNSFTGVALCYGPSWELDSDSAGSMGTWIQPSSIASRRVACSRRATRARASSGVLPKWKGERGAARSVVGIVVGLDTQVKHTQVKHGLKIGTPSALVIAALLAPAMMIAATLTACSDEKAPPREEPPPRRQEAPVSRYEVIDLGEAGSIAGNVRWVGPLPAPVMLPVRSHRDVCGAEQPSQALRVSPRGGVADTVVWLTDVRRGGALAPPSETPVVTLEGCRYRPHVLAVGVGTTIAFRSADPVLHNVHALRNGETLWDFALEAEGSGASREVEVPGVIRMLSDVHSFMQAWVHAFDDPYFAVTDENGRFHIPDVPAGQYVMRVWHEGWRVVGTEAGRPVYSQPVVLSRTLSVAIRKEITVDFELSARSAEIAGQ